MSISIDCDTVNRDIFRLDQFIQLDLREQACCLFRTLCRKHVLFATAIPSSWIAYPCITQYCNDFDPIQKPRNSYQLITSPRSHVDISGTTSHESNDRGTHQGLKCFFWDVLHVNFLLQHFPRRVSLTWFMSFCLFGASCVTLAIKVLQYSSSCPLAFDKAVMWNTVNRIVLLVTTKQCY